MSDNPEKFGCKFSLPSVYSASSPSELSKIATAFYHFPYSDFGELKPLSFLFAQYGFTFWGKQIFLFWMFGLFWEFHRYKPFVQCRSKIIPQEIYPVLQIQNGHDFLYWIFIIIHYWDKLMNLLGTCWVLVGLLLGSCGVTTTLLLLYLNLWYYPPYNHIIHPTVYFYSYSKI